MKLSNAQKDFLKKQLGYNDEDISIIEKSSFTFDYYDDRDPATRDIPVRVSRKKAESIIGKWGFASGCARATFHRTACRTAMAGLDTILFERV